MIRQVLQTLGIISLTSGAVLFIQQNFVDTTTADKSDLAAENSSLKQQLAETKVALADAQQTTKLQEKKQSTKAHNKNSSSNDRTKNVNADADSSVIKMILTLSRGDTSKSAAISLEKSGIIKSASDFERYLNDKGLSGKIQTGQHIVDSSMDFQALAKELTTIRN